MWEKQTVIVGEDIIPTHKHVFLAGFLANLGSFVSLEQEETG